MDQDSKLTERRLRDGFKAERKNKQMKQTYSDLESRDVECERLLE